MDRILEFETRMVVLLTPAHGRPMALCHIYFLPYIYTFLGLILTSPKRRPVRTAVATPEGALNLADMSLVSEYTTASSPDMPKEVRRATEHMASFNEVRNRLASR